jgi:hypothetical protein
MKALFILLAFSLMAGMLFAQDDSGQTTAQPTGGMNNVKVALSDLCIQVKSIIPVVLFLMIVVGGVVYSAGQVFGAEVRSRANVWATAMVIGAIICVLIITVLPSFLATMYGDPNVSWDCG